jgi:hypothetical protein
MTHSEKGQGTCLPANSYTLESLEPRVLASAAPATNSSPLTVADRNALIAHLTAGPLTASLTKTLKRSGPDAFDATLLRYMERRDTARYFFRSKDAPAYLDFLVNRYNMGMAVTAAVARADKTVAHLFPEQNNSDTATVQLPPGAIDWDTLPDSTTNADFLHTLNRHSAWVDVAMAARATRRPGYAAEVVAELESWSADNAPPADADNWSTPGASPRWWLLDAADRADNWIKAYYLLLGTSGWTPAANTLFLKELWDHGDFLARVTPGSRRANRTTLHATGLLDIAILFPEFAQAAAWERQAGTLMFECLETQFYPDGGHVEETPAYQGLAADAFLQAWWLEQRNGRPAWRRSQMRRLTRAVESYYQFWNGTLPGLSDTYRNGGNPGQFFGLAAAILGDERYRVPISFRDFWLVGPDRLPSIRKGYQYDPTVQGRGNTFAMPDAGYYIADTFGSERLYFDAGPKGGSHGHYDLLNFEMSGGSTYTVPDPGPFVYDNSPQRQWAVSTPAHNTISIDGKSHAAIEGAHDPRIVVDRFEDDGDAVWITAHHHAYQSLPGRPVVGRTMWVNRKSWDERNNDRGPLAVVVDWGRSSVPHTFTSSLTLNPSNRLAPGVVDGPRNHTYEIRVQSLLSAGQSDTLTPTSISLSAPPAAAVPASRYAVSQTGTFAVFVTLISQWVPSRKSWSYGPPVTIAWEGAPPTNTHQTVRIRLSYPDGGPSFVLEFTPPDLTPLPPSQVPPPPATTFATRPIPPEDELWDA